MANNSLKAPRMGQRAPVGQWDRLLVYRQHRWWFISKPHRQSSASPTIETGSSRVEQHGCAGAQLGLCTVLHCAPELHHPNGSTAETMRQMEAGGPNQRVSQISYPASGMGRRAILIHSPGSTSLNRVEFHKCSRCSWFCSLNVGSDSCSLNVFSENQKGSLSWKYCKMLPPIGKAVRFYEMFMYITVLMVILEKFGTSCPQTLTYDRFIVFLKVGTRREFSLGNGYVI